MEKIEDRLELDNTTPLTIIMTKSLQNETKKRQLRTMQIYAGGLVGILVVFGLSFISAYWRVGKSDRYQGTPFKSVSDAESLFKPLETKPAETPPEIKQAETTNILESKEEIIPVQGAVKTINLNPPKLEITDPDSLKMLKLKLFDRIDKTWQTYPSFTSSLIYEVTVDENGAIVDYQNLNRVAKDYQQETPLPQLLKAQSSDKSSPQPTAKFTVLFAPNGVLEVNP